MLLKQNIILLITLISLAICSCVDVPSTAPVIPDKLKTSAKIDEVIDVKTLEENTEAESDEKIDGIVEEENNEEEK